MKKSELIKALATRQECSQKEAELFLNNFGEVVKNSLLIGEEIELIGLGTFKPDIKAKRNGVNPKTHEKIIIAESKTVKFKLSPKFKEKLNS